MFRPLSTHFQAALMFACRLIASGEDETTTIEQTAALYLLTHTERTVLAITLVGEE